MYYLQINYKISYSNWGIIPFTWFLYFYAGLKWRNLSIKLNTFFIVLLICLAYFIEITETYFLFSLTNNSAFSSTPIRFSAILYVIPFILLFLKLKDTIQPKNNILISLGNNSFGIYLSHMVILSCVFYVANKILNTICYNPIQYILYVTTILLITIIITNILITICKEFMPNTFLKCIGFI